MELQSWHPTRCTLERIGLVGAHFRQIICFALILWISTASWSWSVGPVLRPTDQCVALLLCSSTTSFMRFVYAFIKYKKL